MAPDRHDAAHGNDEVGDAGGDHSTSRTGDSRFIIIATYA